MLTEKRSLRVKVISEGLSILIMVIKVINKIDSANLRYIFFHQFISPRKARPCQSTNHPWIPILMWHRGSRKRLQLQITGWGSRIRTSARGFRVRCPTARLIPIALEVIALLTFLKQYRFGLACPFLTVFYLTCFSRIRSFFQSLYHGLRKLGNILRFTGSDQIAVFDHRFVNIGCSGILQVYGY